VGLTVALALAEIGARVAALDVWMMRPLVGVQEADPEIHRLSSDPELLYELIPDLRVTLPPCEGRWCDRPREVTTNALGFRDTPRQLVKPAGVCRVLALGGSNTYGAAVSDGETWPALLEQQLAPQGDVEVWNLGVSGYMNRQKAALGRRMIDEADPDLILLQVYNTGLRFFPEGQSLRGAVRANPGLVRENLVAAPAAGEPDLLWRISRLYRIARVATELRSREASPSTHRAALVARADVQERRAVDDLVAAARGRAGLVVVVPRVTRADERLLGGDLPVIDLRPLDPPNGDEGRDSHPRRDVYAWYAARIAEALVAGGCLDRPLECAPEVTP